MSPHKTLPAHERKLDQRGMAVIGALIVVALVALAGSAIIERQALLAQTLETDKHRTQARWALRGGLDWARLVLYNDGQRNPITRDDAMWAQPVVGMQLSVPSSPLQALFTGRIEDEQSKLNLALLLQNGAARTRQLAALQRIALALGLPGNTAERIEKFMRDRQAMSPAGTGTAGLRGVDELRGTVLNEREWQVLAPFVTLLPATTSINVNTAEAEVLSAALPALDLVQARELVEQRTRGQWFNDTADFLNRSGLRTTETSLPLGVNSDWFKVTGTVTLEHARLGMQALLHRAGTQLPALRWIKE